MNPILNKTSKGFISLLVLIIVVVIIAFLFVKYAGVFVNNPRNSATSTEPSGSLLAPIDYAQQAASSADEYSQNIQKIFDQAKKAGQAQ